MIHGTKTLIRQLFDERIENAKSTAPDGSISHEVLLIDELFELLNDAKVMDHLTALATISPKIGVHLVIATQYSPAKLNEEFLKLMPNRIILKCHEDASLALLGTLDAATLPRGQCALSPRENVKAGCNENFR